jgi:hypothetical protein
VIVPEGSQQTFSVRLLFSPAAQEISVNVTSSNIAVANVTDPVVIPAGAREAAVILNTYQTGEATLYFDAGTESRGLKVIVGLPPADKVPPTLALPVGVAVIPSYSSGQVIVGESEQQIFSVQLLFSPAPVDTPVSVTSSNTAVADVTAPVVIPAGAKNASVTLNTGQAGEATLTLDAGDEVRKLRVIVGLPPADQIPPTLAHPVGVQVIPPYPAGQVIVEESSLQTFSVRLLFSPASTNIPVAVSSSNTSVANVAGPVVIPAGSRDATVNLDTGIAGEAVIRLDAGDEVRELIVIVGTPPNEKVPPIVAPIVGVEVAE